MSAVKAISSLFKRLQDQGSQLKRGLAEIREEIAAAQAEVERIQRLPRPREEAEAEIRDLVEAGAQSFGPYLGDFARPGGANLMGVMNTLNGSHGAIQRNQFGFMCAVAPAGVFEFLARGLDAAYAEGPGLTAAERATRLAKADARLLELSLAEEAAVRALEAAGMAVARRPDADPRAVLAADSDLPS